LKRRNPFGPSELWQPRKNDPVAEDRHPRVPHFDFSKIPIHPPEPSRREATAGQSFSPLPEAPSLPLQAKLEVGAVDDPLEREADRVADFVMRTPAEAAPATGPSVKGAGDALQRKCERCEEDQKIQRKADGARAGGEVAARPLVHELLQSSGQALDPETRTFMESRFGHDFSGVRVHTDARAADSARSLGARAFTAGRHIVFGEDEYAPQTMEGKRLLAHELTHAVQQSSHVDGARADVVRRTPAGRCGAGLTRTCASTTDCGVSDAPGSGGAATSWQMSIKIDIEAEKAEDVEPATVGHVFVEFRTSAGEVNTFGFYPDPAHPVNEFHPKQPGCMVHPDTVHAPCVDYTEQFTLSQAEYNAALDLARLFCKAHPEYDVLKFNCTTFALRLASAAGKSLPNAHGSVSKYNVVTDNPNTLIENLRDRDIPSRHLSGDTEIRNWVSGQALSALTALPTAEKIRLIDRLMSYWVSEGDLAASEKLCSSVTSAAEMKTIRDAISSWEKHLNTAQGTRLHTALNRL
jgi:hypothetical protein